MRNILLVPGVCLSGNIWRPSMIQPYTLRCRFACEMFIHVYILSDQIGKAASSTEAVKSMRYLCRFSSLPDRPVLYCF